ncbi:uncharacterized protein EV420DRAFT_1487773 [Desarmillaria tabescens]|uniref:Uncharacterized protein n=1 Tax=Armillaria tabescens TaxID=1929756 RepID=A0AA39J4E1_ARMTA|nr:uncharacterized protein EV420DRAFT_1487773 [Desarmillaria tabescens]KAK0435936.1 hypothetical protein EV420DRAFT_1487773 [Desarmillaria tabescens]
MAEPSFGFWVSDNFYELDPAYHHPDKRRAVLFPDDVAFTDCGSIILLSITTTTKAILAIYLARYNTGDDNVPYDPSLARCQAVLVNGPWTEISIVSCGVQDGIFELSYAKYVVKMGLEAPWVTEAVMENRPEQGTADTPGFGMLLYNLRLSNST